MQIRLTLKLQRGIRSVLAFGVLLALLSACGGQLPPDPPPPPPPPAGAARVFITSPVHGSSVSGAVYFAAQLLSPADLASVELRIGGEVVSHEFPGETPLRVFLIPRDHPEGPLELSASVGTGSSRFETKITVNVVHEPPASATVAAGGAILGGEEAGGAISTLVIPAGVAQGATVEFETMTQAEVLAATGVSYDDLGVTFLGAQEIRSTIPTGDGVQMTSGGFGPMVQPGQIVVSYRIVPDMGRGVDELMVINTASVAPNGDIVSGRPVEPQAGDAVTTSSFGVIHTAALYPQQTTLTAGPPGTRLEFVVNGLNIYAPFGYQTRFRRGGTTVDTPALVGLNGDGSQYLLGYVPQISPGAVTVELVAVVGDDVFASYQMNVTASPAVANPKAVVDTALADLLAEIADVAADFQGQGVSLNFGPLTDGVTEARAYWAGRPASDPELVALARMLVGGGFGLASTSLAPVSFHPAQTSALCVLNARKYAFDKELSKRAFNGDRFETGLRGLQGRLSLDYLDRFADRLEGSEYDCDPYKEILCEEYGIGPGCDDDEVVYPEDDSPNDPRPRPPRRPGGGGGPNDWVTGMGSVLPSGGPLGGSGDGGDGGSGLRSAGGLSPQQLTFPLEPGRFTVRGLLGGTVWPFATTIAEDGYFFLPALPAQNTLQLVVSDRQTLQECVIEVQGRSSTSANALYVDLPTCFAGEPVDPDDYTIVWVSAAATGNWNAPTNWDPPRVPNQDDDVLIPSVASEVSLPTGAVNIRSLKSNGIVRLMNTNLSASGDIDLSWLRISNAGATIEAAGELSYRNLRINSNYTLPPTVTTLERLHVNCCVLSFAHELQVSQSLILHTGSLGGSGRTIMLPGATGGTSGNVGVGVFSGGGLVGSHTLEVRSTFDWLTEGVRLRIDAEASLYVAPGGVARMGSLVSSVVDGSSEIGLVNHGLLLVTTPLARFPGSFHNHGTVEIAAGSELALTPGNDGPKENFGLITGEGLLHTDHFSGTDGSSALVHHPEAVINVARFRLIAEAAVSVSLQGQIAVRELELRRGLLVIDQDLELERLTIHMPPAAGSSTLMSSGTITVSDLLVFDRGILTGTGTTVLEAGGILQMLTANTRTIDGGHTLVNHGTATWGPVGSAQNNITAGSELENRGEFIVQNNRPFTGAGLFHNFGTVHKTTAGTSTWSVCYTGEEGSEIVLDEGAFINLTGACGP